MIQRYLIGLIFMIPMFASAATLTVVLHGVTSEKGTMHV